MKYMLALVICMMSASLDAMNMQNWWQTPDQQGQKAMNKGQYKKAADLFENQDWASSAAYKAGLFDKALKGFMANQSADGQYNAGNVLARQGKYEEAIAAYDRALAKEPTHEDALHNRQVVERLLKQQQQQQQKNQKNNQDKQNKQDKNQSSKENNQDNQQKPSEQEPKDNQKQKEQQDKDSKQQQNKENQATQQDKKADKAKEQAKKDNDFEKQQLLKMIPDDPGGLLREKFLRDYIRRQRGWQL